MRRDLRYLIAVRTVLVAVLLVACGRSSEPPSAAGSGSAKPQKCVETAACEAACKTGDAAACTEATERYFSGANHPLDHGKSFPLAKRACELGNGHGCSLLGFHHQDGLGTAWSPKDAMAAYEKGCKLGTGVACFNLATIYEGHGVDAEPKLAEEFFERAREHWQKACDGDEPRWCTNSAYMIARAAKNDPSPAQLERMLDLDTRTCEAKFLVGCVEKVRVLEDLKRIEPAAAAAELDRLCKAGEPTACTEAGRRLIAAALDTPQSDPRYGEGRKLLERGCTIGDKFACELAALEAIYGKNGQQDFAAAERYFEQACDRALGSACNMLAKKLAGAEDPATQARGADFARRGCQMGNPDACTLIALMTTQGRGVGKDEVKGIEWARAGCSSGGLASCRMLVERQLPLPLPAKELPKVHDALCREGLTSSCGKAS